MHTAVLLAKEFPKGRFRRPMVGFCLPLVGSTTSTEVAVSAIPLRRTVLISQDTRPLTYEVKVLDRDSRKRSEFPDLLLQPVELICLSLTLLKLMILLSRDPNL